MRTSEGGIDFSMPERMCGLTDLKSSVGTKGVLASLLLYCMFCLRSSEMVIILLFYGLDN